MRRLPRVLLTLLPLLACTALAPAHAQSPTTVTRAVPPVTKLLVFVEENHSFDQMRAGMPYTASLAERYGHATDYHAIRHPSLPNYIAIAGGSTYGVTDDRLPPAHRLTGPARAPWLPAEEGGQRLASPPASRRRSGARSPRLAAAASPGPSSPGSRPRPGGWDGPI